MRSRITVALCIAFSLTSVAEADDVIPPVVGGHTYTQHLVMTALQHHPNVIAIIVEGKRDGGTDVVILGSTISATQVFRPVARPVTTIGGTVSQDGKRYNVRTPLMSNSGHRLGTILVECWHRPGAPTLACDRTANAIGKEIAAVTLSAKNAADPFPYDAKFGPNTYAQTITEHTVARYPDLLVMMIHATPPGGRENVIIGSNIGRFGKVADEDDARVIDKGETNLEVGGDADRFETELPLNDATGKRIGALGLVFGYRTGTDKSALHTRGLTIRDEVAGQIPNNAALFKPQQ